MVFLFMPMCFQPMHGHVVYFDMQGSSGAMAKYTEMQWHRSFLGIT